MASLMPKVDEVFDNCVGELVFGVEQERRRLGLSDGMKYLILLVVRSLISAVMWKMVPGVVSPFWRVESA